MYRYNNVKTVKPHRKRRRMQLGKYYLTLCLLRMAKKAHASIQLRQLISEAINCYNVEKFADTFFRVASAE